MESRARKALGEGIRHIARAGAFEECDVTRVDTLVQEMTLDADVTRAITIHDFANSITLGRMKERYYLIIMVDSIDFTWAQTSTTCSEPEDLLHEFITATGIRVSSTPVDGAGE